MKLRDEIHRSIEELDDEALAHVYEQLRLLLQLRKDHDSAVPAPSLEHVMSLTACSQESWSDSLCEQRNDRV